MKLLRYTIIFAGILSAGCNKLIDQVPQSNLNSATFYSNVEEVKSGLTGAYNGLQSPMNSEWMLTELRSDNSRQGIPGSTSAANRELNELDMFFVNTFHTKVYDYWAATYNNIRNANLILQKLGVEYNAATGVTSFANINIAIPDVDRKQLAGEALIIRAYHYYNLVQLYGGVMLVDKILTPNEAKQMNRTTVAEIYKFIVADLKAAADNMNTLKFTQVAAANLGRVTGWTAKGLLGKVYLSLNRKADAIAVLNDVRNNSGHALVTIPGGAGSAFANVFSAANEVNSEILFTIRYKALSGGLGNPFANRFAPLQSGSAVVPGDGSGLNAPTAEIDSIIANTDARKAVSVARWISGANTRVYTRKFIAITQINEGESDWPILRFADILLLLAEAQGYTQSSLDLINQVRTRSGLPNLTMANTVNLGEFEKALSKERRIEFAHENNRWFDINRYTTTLSTASLKALNVIRDHFDFEYPFHYVQYPLPRLTLAEMQALVTTDKLLLPIPQREIDTNTQLVIPQNPGY